MTLVSRFALALLALLGTAALAGAQSPSPDVLNTIVVRQFVAAGTPAAHRALSRHFAALADGYAADADRDASMATAFFGHPNRAVGATAASPYARGAQIAAGLATDARAMSAYHEVLSTGEPAVAPARRTFFDSGGGAPAPTADDLAALAASARTPAEHHDLEEYFLTLAARHDAWADTHLAMAQGLRANANQRGATNVAAHCDRIASQSRAAAKQARQNAGRQRELANIG